MEARDGFIIYFVDKNLKKVGRKVSKGEVPANPRLNKLFHEKFKYLIDAGYIENGRVDWDVRFFLVSKGESDIRLVFDGIRNGLNSVVWTPSFFLPTSNSLS